MLCLNLSGYEDSVLPVSQLQSMFVAMDPEWLSLVVTGCMTVTMTGGKNFCSFSTILLFTLSTTVLKRDHHCFVHTSASLEYGLVVIQYSSLT